MFLAWFIITYWNDCCCLKNSCLASFIKQKSSIRRWSFDVETIIGRSLCVKRCDYFAASASAAFCALRPLTTSSIL